MNGKLRWIAWACCMLGLAGCSDSSSGKVAQMPAASSGYGSGGASSGDAPGAPPADGASGVEQASTDQGAAESAPEEVSAEDGALAEGAGSESAGSEVVVDETGGEVSGEDGSSDVTDSSGGNAPYENPASGRQGYSRNYGGTNYDERPQQVDESGEPMVRANYGDAGEGSEEGGDSEVVMEDSGVEIDPSDGSVGFGAPMPSGFGPGGGRMMGPPVPPPPVPLKDLAERQFRSGDERRGMNLLYAQAITGEGDASQLLQGYGWVPDLLRPVMAERWGIGVVYKPGEKPIEGDDLGVIGPPDDSPGGGGDRGAVGGGAVYGSGDFAAADGEGEGGVGDGATRATFDKYTGYLGQLLIDRLQKRMEAGDFGRPLKTPSAVAMAGVGDNVAGDFGGSDPSMAADVQPVGPPGGYGVGPPPGRGPGSYGSVGSFESGEFGGDGATSAEESAGEEAGGEEAGGEEAGGEEAGGEEAGTEGSVSVGHLSRGITLLGVADSSNKLLELARQQELDVLLVVDVAVKLVGRNQTVSNATRVRLFDVRQGKAVYVQRKALINGEVNSERRRGREPVKAAVDDLFKHVSEKLKLTSLPPKLQAPQAQKRVAGLAKSFEAQEASSGSGKSASNPLPVMAEMAMYHQRGLIDQPTLHQGYAALVGDEVARALTSGQTNQAKRSLAKVLEMDPDQLGPPMETGGSGGTVAGRATGLFQGLLRAFMPSLRPSGPMGGPPPGMPPGMGGPPGMEPPPGWDNAGEPLDGSDGSGGVSDSGEPLGDGTYPSAASGAESGK